MADPRNLNCKTRPVQRAAGQSAVAGAAYRAGERLFDERQERVADFSRRSGDVRETLILTPEGAPAWASDRSALWNAAEVAEKRKDGRPARDVQLGLAWELSPEEQREAVVEFAEAEFVSKGHVADIAFHRYGQRVTDLSDEGRSTIRRWAEQDVPFMEAAEAKDLNSPHVKIERRSDGHVSGYKIYQPHAHVFVTPRALDGDGFASKRNREFDRSETAMRWRYEWPKLQNDYLERAGEEVRVTATRRKDGTEQIGLRDESVQGVARSMELRGEETRAREDADFAQVHNEMILQASADTDQLPAEAPSEGLEAPTRDMAAPADAFEAVHASVKAQAAFDRAGTPDQQQQNRMQRVAAWWHNMGQSFSSWRDDVRERVSERWQHIRGSPEETTTKEPDQGHEQD